MNYFTCGWDIDGGLRARVEIGRNGAAYSTSSCYLSASFEKLPSAPLYQSRGFRARRKYVNLAAYLKPRRLFILFCNFSLSRQSKPAR